MIDRSNYLQTDNSLIDEQLTAQFRCPICNTKYASSRVNHCSVCGWDLTLCPKAGDQSQNVYIESARGMWAKLQAQKSSLPTDINAEIDDNPQLFKLREESNLEVWDLLITWICGVDLDVAHTAVSKLQRTYQDKTPSELAQILIVQKSFQAAGVEIAIGFPTVASLLNGLASVDLPLVAQLSAEMIYQIAGIYGFDLQASERRLEVLSTFGIAFLGEKAIEAGIDWMAHEELIVGNVMSACAKGLMIYAVGNAARLFYEAKVERHVNPLNSSNIFSELRRNSQAYIKFATSEDAIIDIISSEVEVASIISSPRRASYLEEVPYTFETSVNPLSHPHQSVKAVPNVRHNKSDDIYEILVSILTRELDLDSSEISLRSNLRKDIGLDSLSTIEIIMALEEEFDLEIPDEDVPRIKTVRDAVDYINRKTR